MVTSCPICRDVVHVYAGYFVRHGVHHHGRFELCSGSGSPVFIVSDCCSGSI